MKRAAATFAALLLASACRTGRVPESGTIEVSIPGVHKLLVADALTRAMLNRGYRIRGLDEKQAVFARAADAVPGAMLLGARDNAPETRVRCALSEEGVDVRITAKIEVVTNSGSRYEHLSAPNGGDDAERVRQALSAVKDRLIRKTAAPPPPPQPAAAAPAPAPEPAPARRAPQPAPGRAPAAAKAETRSEPKGDWDQSGEDLIEQMRKRALNK